MVILRLQPQMMMQYLTNRPIASLFYLLVNSVQILFSVQILDAFGQTYMMWTFPKN